MLNALCYYLPSLMGDPVVPGWITPALPLTINWLSQWSVLDFGMGNVDRIYAMIALQMLVAVSFLIMGVSGLGRKLVQMVPMSIKAGIVLGAGVTAGMNGHHRPHPARTVDGHHRCAPVLLLPLQPHLCGNGQEE